MESSAEHFRCWVEREGKREGRERREEKVSLVSSFSMPPHFLVFKLISMEEERKSWHKGSCLVSSFSLGNVGHSKAAARALAGIA